jgi:hypothetical protein
MPTKFLQTNLKEPFQEKHVSKRISGHAIRLKYRSMPCFTFSDLLLYKPTFLKRKKVNTCIENDFRLRLL